MNTTKSQSIHSINMSQTHLKASSNKAKEPNNQTPTNQRPSRAKSVTHDATHSNVRRALLQTNKPKSGELVLGSNKSKDFDEFKVVGGSSSNSIRRSLVVVEQFAKPRRQRPNVEDDPHRRMKEKIEGCESLIMNLQAEVLGLKAELDGEKDLNMELMSQNQKLSEDLAASEAKIAALTIPHQQRESNGYQSSKFKDLQKLIANKLESSVVKKEAVNESTPIKAAASPPAPPLPVIRRVAATFSPPPPPPPLPSLRSPPPPSPPPPPQPLMRVSSTQKAPELVQIYRSLKKQEVKRDSSQSKSHQKSGAVSAHNSIVDEIQNRSAHLIAIRADVETKGEFINGLIQKVLTAAYRDIEDVLKFVDWLDGQLASLADETAVLKHFKWPERKADAMREAVIEYRDLKLLETEISSYKDDTTVQCAVALKKMAVLLDRSERSVQRLVKLRNSVMRSYQECKIPTDWMLDSGIVSKIKQASVNLAKIYMKRVTSELESVRYSDKESSHESLLVQGVNFAYRAYQFSGGFDSETLCAFEDIRQRVPRNLGGSQDLLAGIASS